MKIIYLILTFTISIPTLLVGQKIEHVNNNYEKGLIVDGYKKGIWEYFDSGVLKLKVNYTTGKFVYLAKDTSKYAIETKNGWKLSKLDIYPHYIGSMNEVLKILAMNIRYPNKAINNSITGTVLLGFEVNLQGRVDSIQILKDIGGGCGKEVLRVFHMVPDYWLVARKGGKQYISRYILPVRFQIGKRTRKADIWKKETKTELKELNETKVAFSPSNYLEEVVVSAIR